MAFQTKPRDLMKRHQSGPPQWFDPFFEDSFKWFFPQAVETMSKCDVYELDNRWVYELELPGMDKDHIDISIERDTLVVRGEITRDEAVDDQLYFTMGRRYGQFQRRFRLPPGFVQADAGNIEATLEKGILTISIPLNKKSTSDPVHIEIR